MSDDRDPVAQASPPEHKPAQSAPESVEASPTAPATNQLDAIEDIDFLLEEIENKIAPLALA